MSGGSSCPSPAPAVDKRLAELFRNEPDPFEPLAADQGLAQTVWHTGTAKLLTSRGRLVQLECGHFVVTKALHKAACPRCGEMIRAGWDHDAFRRLKEHDTFSWPGDPLRVLHETGSGDAAVSLAAALAGSPGAQ